MLTNLIDEALSWPNKIDIYFYAPGAGGEFFTTLCSLSHLPTREILYSQNIEAVKFKIGAIAFKSAMYFNYEEIFVSELGKHLCFYSKYITDPLECINYYRMVLAHSFLNIPSEDVHNLNNKKNILKNKNIILCTHWIKIHSTDKKNGPNFDNRTFGIPLFEKQIQKGGPITVTDERVTRFFMTIPEACQLVLEAAAMGHGGEVFVFDMGEPVKIIDLAKKMIALSGLKLGEDIQIQVTGLRPGEKLYEELLLEGSETSTQYKSITVAGKSEYEIERLSRDIEELLNSQDKLEKLKQIVPEFIHLKNS
jgi:hypothetical protein